MEYFRLNTLTSIMEAYNAYDQEATLTCAKDASIRSKCLVETVINLARLAFHSLQARWLEMKSASQSEKALNACKITQHQSAAAIATNKAKAYAEAIISPRKGLLKVYSLENVGASFTKKLAEVGEGVINLFS